MRVALTSLVLAATTLAANAQFSLTPKAGLESSRTSISYNDVNCISPLGAYASPQIGLRLDYKFKKQHGPYVGLALNRTTVAMQFDDPETGMTNYTASAGDRTIRIEGGYQYSFKPISLGSKNKSSSTPATAKQNTSTQSKSGCHKSRSSCGSKSKQALAKAPAKNKSWNMRIQPSLGMAYVPGNNPNVETNIDGANYQYNAGNFKTAVIAGTDFEFGRGRDRLFTVGVQYMKGLGNNAETITTQSANKSSTAYLSSRTSAWNITLGMPFTLSKSKSKSQHHKSNKQEIKKRCIYYSPCRRA